MLQVLANGLVNGAVLALIAISLTIIFGILRVPHFSLGGVFVWGAFVADAAAEHGVPFAAAVLLAAVATALAGVAIERLAFRPLRAATEEAMFVSAIGVLIAMENAALLVGGGETRSIPVPERLSFVVSFGGLVYLPPMRVVICAVTAAAFAALLVFVRTTRVGKAMRAVAQDRVAARLLGIPIDRIASWTFAIGSGLAGLAGALVGAALTFNFEMGSLGILKAFVVVVLGGLGSVAGALVGGLALGGGRQPDADLRHLGVQAAGRLRSPDPRAGAPARRPVRPAHRPRGRGRLVRRAVVAHPDFFNFVVSVDLFLAVMLGGAGTLAGPLVGVLVLEALREVLHEFVALRLLPFGVLPGGADRVLARRGAAAAGGVRPRPAYAGPTPR